MAEQNKVILYGMYASPYAKAVELVLKVKGIPFEYKEEDLMNKSESLLKFNPVHKKVPVLVHNGKAIAESLVIIEYIDEVWKTKGPQFLPEDPFQRSQVRFWAGYICQVFESLTLVFVTTGEAQDKAIKATYEKLDTLEEGLKGLYPNGKFTSSVEDYSKNVTLIELLIVSFYGAYEALNEAIDINFIDPEKTPLVFSCIRSLIQIPAVKEAHAPHEKMVSFLKFFREYALKSGYHY